jgi:hypothetical protein
VSIRRFRRPTPLARTVRYWPANERRLTTFDKSGGHHCRTTYFVGTNIQATAVRKAAQLATSGRWTAKFMLARLTVGPQNHRLIRASCSKTSRFPVTWLQSSLDCSTARLRLVKILTVMVPATRLRRQRTGSDLVDYWCAILPLGGRNAHDGYFDHTAALLPGLLRFLPRGERLIAKW